MSVKRSLLNKVHIYFTGGEHCEITRLIQGKLDCQWYRDDKKVESMVLNDDGFMDYMKVELRDMK